jgi:hypothetical protein
LSSEKKVQRVLLLLCVASFSCREIEPFYGSQNIQGYQVDGILTTSNGIPIEGARVELYYYYRYNSEQSVDSVQAVVTDSSQMIDVSVYTTDYEYLKTLYSGRAGMTGLIPYYVWDGKDWHGDTLPSGKYLIRYVIDNTIIKYSTTILEGHVSAVTDYRGMFSISNEHLPIGELFDVYFLSGQFYASYQVEERIELVFRYGYARSGFIPLDLQKNKITTGAFTL